MPPYRKIKTSLYIDERLLDYLNRKRITEERTLTYVLNRTLENGIQYDAFNATELPIDVDELEKK